MRRAPPGVLTYSATSNVSIIPSMAWGVPVSSSPIKQSAT